MPVFLRIQEKQELIMNALMTTIVSVSLAALLVLAIIHYFRYKNSLQLVLHLVILGVVVFPLVTYVRGDGATARGNGLNIYVVIVLYLFMLLGMLSQYLYHHFSIPKQKRKKREFDFGLFIAPVFASPIVFIPIITAFQHANIDFTDFQMVKVSIFLVAFQNGFFWKEFFDNQRKTCVK